MDVKNLNEVPAFITKDGAEIRELLAHRNSAIRNQSLAEERVPSGGSTQEHFHPCMEEIYDITQVRLPEAPRSGTSPFSRHGQLGWRKPSPRFSYALIALMTSDSRIWWNSSVDFSRLTTYRS